MENATTIGRDRLLHHTDIEAVHLVYGQPGTYSYIFLLYVYTVIDIVRICLLQGTEKHIL